MPAKSQAQRALLNAKFGHEWVKKHHFDNKGKLPKHKAQEAIVADLVEVLLHHGAPMPTRPGSTDDQCWQNYLDLKQAGELQSQQRPTVPARPTVRRRRYSPPPKTDTGWMDDADRAAERDQERFFKAAGVVSFLLGEADLPPGSTDDQCWQNYQDLLRQREKDTTPVPNIHSRPRKQNPYPSLKVRPVTFRRHDAEMAAKRERGAQVKLGQEKFWRFMSNLDV